MFTQTQNSRNSMNAEFNLQFKVGRTFSDREELKNVVTTFGKTFNVIYSIDDSHPKRGTFSYICKHGGTKREIKKDDTESTENDLKRQPKKTTQKFRCPSFFNINKWTLTKNCMEHNHPIPQDFSTYAINRRQSPEVMRRIYNILSSGARDPVGNVLVVSVTQRKKKRNPN